MLEIFDYEYLITPPEGIGPISAIRYLIPLTTRGEINTGYKLSDNKDAIVFSSSESVLSTLEKILPTGYKYKAMHQSEN